MPLRDYKATGKFYCPGVRHGLDPYNGKKRTVRATAESQKDAESQMRLETLEKLGVPRSLFKDYIVFVSLHELTSTPVKVFRATEERSKKIT